MQLIAAAYELDFDCSAAATDDAHAQPDVADGAVESQQLPPIQIAAQSETGDIHLISKCESECRTNSQCRSAGTHSCDDVLCCSICVCSHVSFDIISPVLLLVAFRITTSTMTMNVFCRFILQFPESNYLKYDYFRNEIFQNYQFSISNDSVGKCAVTATNFQNVQKINHPD